MKHFFHHQAELLEAGEPFATVTVVDVTGSVPQNQGAKMLVTTQGLHHGTVGGGKVENLAIEEARAMLRDDGERQRFVEWNLKRDVGMTCGGSMKLFFEVHNVAAWQIVVFGAGHVAQSLTRLLVRLDCRVTCYDTRPEWLNRLPDSPRLRRVHSEDLPGEVAGLPEGAFVALMTMGHTSDKPILLEILRTRTFPYLGVIGSAGKAMRLKKDVTEAGLPPEAREAFFCPIGLPIGTHHPGEIAVSIAAQLIQERDRLHGVARSSATHPRRGKPAER